MNVATWTNKIESKIWNLVPNSSTTCSYYSDPKTSLNCNDDKTVLSKMENQFFSQRLFFTQISFPLQRKHDDEKKSTRRSLLSLIAVLNPSFHLNINLSAPFQRNYGVEAEGEDEESRSWFVMIDAPTPTLTDRNMKNWFSCLWKITPKLLVTKQCWQSDINLSPDFPSLLLRFVRL